MYVCVGLGILTKGPIAALLPGLVFAPSISLAHRELGRTREMLVPLGTVIVLAIVLPWYAALYQQWGWAPIKSFFFGENLARYVDGVGVNADRPVWWYLPVVFSDSFPWSLFLFPAAALWLRERRRAGACRDVASSHPDVALDLDCGHRRLFLALGGQAGPLHLPDCPGDRRARRRCHRAIARAGGRRTHRGSESSRQ